MKKATPDPITGKSVSQSALNRRNEGKKTTTDIALSTRVNPF